LLSSKALFLGVPIPIYFSYPFGEYLTIPLSLPKLVSSYEDIFPDLTASGFFDNTIIPSGY